MKFGRPGSYPAHPRLAQPWPVPKSHRRTSNSKSLSLPLNPKACANEPQALPDTLRRGLMRREGARMPNYRFTTVDVFTDQRFGGNPLAVFTDANGMADGEMQSLATEFNLSETTFVLPPHDPTHTARVRIFNRTHEMRFAGHPTVGTAFALARMASGDAEIFEFEVLAGLVAVRIERDADGILRGATIDAPQPLLLGPQISPESIAGCIGLDTSDIIVAAHPPVEASVGNTYVIAEVSETALSRAVPDVSAFRRLLERSPALNGRFSLYLYSRDGNAIDAR